MATTTAPSDGTVEHADPAASWRALLHRWFVTYNPTYLVSAALVLAGLTLLSRGLASAPNAPDAAEAGVSFAPLCVALVAEVYAGALIGGAALLYRMGDKRAAVMLALLAVVYQADLTLHTETCAVLGGVFLLASALWLGAFALKLVALARALRVQIAPRALATAITGAAGLALLPYALGFLTPEGGGNGVALFVFTLGALLPPRLADSVTSRDTLGPWGRLVLRRATLASWCILGALLALHVAFWRGARPFEAARVIPALLALMAARQRRERHVWGAALGALACFGLLAPAQVYAVASLVALSLTLRAFTSAAGAPAERASVEERSPYRAPAEAGLPPTHVSSQGAPETEGLRVSPAERVRLLTGALAAAYVAFRTLGWRGGALPDHPAVVDALFVVASLVMAWRLGARVVLLGAPAVALCELGGAGLLPRPRGLVEWGGVALGLGFLLLLGPLLASCLPTWIAARRARSGHPRAEPHAPINLGSAD